MQWTKLDFKHHLEEDHNTFHSLKIKLMEMHDPLPSYSRLQTDQGAVTYEGTQEEFQVLTCSPNSTSVTQSSGVGQKMNQDKMHTFLLEIY